MGGKRLGRRSSDCESSKRDVVHDLLDLLEVVLERIEPCPVVSTNDNSNDISMPQVGEGTQDARQRGKRVRTTSKRVVLEVEEREPGEQLADEGRDLEGVGVVLESDGVDR